MMSEEIDDILLDESDPILEKFKDVIGDKPVNTSDDKAESKTTIESLEKKRVPESAAVDPLPISSSVKKGKKSRKTSKEKSSEQGTVWHNGYFRDKKQCICYLTVKEYNLLKYISAKQNKSIHSIISSQVREYLNSCAEAYAKELSEALADFK